MRLRDRLKSRAALLDENEALRCEIARLRVQLDTAQSISWIRPRNRAEPHPVDPARHRVDATEIHPRPSNRK